MTFLPKILSKFRKLKVMYGGSHGSTQYSSPPPLTIVMICREYLRRLIIQFRIENISHSLPLVEFDKNIDICPLKFIIEIDRNESLDKIPDVVDKQVGFIKALFSNSEPIQFYNCPMISSYEEATIQRYDGISLTCVAITGNYISVELAIDGSRSKWLENNGMSSNPTDWSTEQKTLFELTWG